MLDWETTTGSSPTVSDAVAFIDEFRKLGGTCNLAYLPKWYWQQIGSPSLQPVIDRKISLVSSDYLASGYSDTGPWLGRLWRNVASRLSRAEA
jgi:hypothetical protein